MEKLEIYKNLIPVVFDSDYFFWAIGFLSLDTALYGFASPHNLFLYIFLGFGSLGLLLAIFFLVKYIKVILRNYLEDRSIVKTYLLISFFALIIHSMVSGIYLAILSMIVVFYFLIFFNQNFFKAVSFDSNFKNTTLYFYKYALISMAMIQMLLIYYLYIINFHELKIREINNNNIEKKTLDSGLFLYNNLFKDK